RGLRFRLHGPKLPGKPDIVLPKYRAVILVHGCFWHRHDGCKYCYMPRSNTEFWKIKFAGTINRDASHIAALEEHGWRIAIVWECALKSPELERTCDEVFSWLSAQSRLLELPRKPHPFIAGAKS